MRDYVTISKRLRQYSENCVAYKLDADFANAVTDAADAIEELLAKVPTWHPVSEKPTRTNQTHARDTFLVRLESGYITTLVYEYDNSDRCRPGMSPLFGEGWGKTVVPVTHWMPLPAPPKGVE